MWINYFQSRTWQELTCITLLLLNWNYLLCRLICFRISSLNQNNGLQSTLCPVFTIIKTQSHLEMAARARRFYIPLRALLFTFPQTSRGANIPKGRRAHFSGVLLHIFLCETCIGNFSFFFRSELIWQLFG